MNVFMEFGKPDWRTFELGVQKEWLLTNGIGGFASSTIVGANTRRYHGLLIAALKPPVERHLVISKVDESISADGREYNLYAFKTPDFIMKGYHHLQRVVFDPLPVFVYSIEDIFIEKRICMVYGRNTTAVSYHIVNSGGKITLKLTPLVNYRDYHHNSKRRHMVFSAVPYGNGILVKPYNMEIAINVYVSEGIFIKQDDCWFYNMEYPVEQERGLDFHEDHYIPGYFEIEVRSGEDKYVTVIATVEKELEDTDGCSIIENEKKRIKKLMDITGYEDDFALALTAAADNFIVQRSTTNSKTIIAGYPWFTDWGRDAMIALPGLTLCTRRFEDAKQILHTFSLYIKDGLIPNVFPDEGEEPGYNTVDASMWYFEAVGKYIRYTGDYGFIRDSIYSSLKEIIYAYMKGTHFNIKMDEDHLISAGNEKTQLTWMDAKAGGCAVTPRHGKAVEINSLWYNALRIMSGLADKFGEDGTFYNEIAAKIKESFIKSFWNEEKQCLYDAINGSIRDDSVRPNQIMAVSLINPVVTGGMARKIVLKVWKELYTAYGLRSLSPFSEEYRGIYINGPYQRDSAYHQGTVWVWPLGHFITGFLKVCGNNKKNREIALNFIKPFRDHLRDACVGSISEIFDGEEPLIPRGCFAQAWSVGEILRAYVEIGGWR